MKRTKWTVTPPDVRPARDDGTCFYCCVPLGREHKADCVIRSRTVVCDITLRVVRRVPEDWDAGMIEFSMNDSSWCASNILEEVQDVTTGARCLCDRFTGKFVAEATEEDEERYGVGRD